jgi:hypothetical protein
MPIDFKDLQLSDTVRSFKQPDATMVQHITTMLAHFEADAAAWVAFSPEFDAAFWAAGVQAVAAVGTHSPAPVRQGELLEATAALTAALVEGRQQFQRLHYAAGQAFGRRSPHLDRYGANRYAKARTVPARLLEVLALALEMALTDADQLAAKGYTAPQRAALLAASEALFAANQRQKAQQGRNKQDTCAAIFGLNCCYWFGQQLSRAVPFVFPDSAPRQACYRLGRAPSEGHRLSLNPARQARRAVVRLAHSLGEGRQLALTVVAAGGQQLRLALLARADAPLPATAPVLGASPAGRPHRLSPAALGAGGPYLVLEADGPLLARVVVSVRLLAGT